MGKTLEQIKAEAADEVYKYMVQDFGMATGVPTRQMANGVTALFHRELSAVHKAAGPLPEGVRTADQVRESMRLRKLKVTKTAYEATVTGDTAEQAVALAVQIDSRYLAHQEQGKDMPGKQEPNRGDMPPWVTPEGNLMAAGGVTGPRNHLVEDLQKDYRVKIEITRNTRGVGWDIEVKPTGGGLGSIDEAMAMRAEVERLLRAAFQTS